MILASRRSLLMSPRVLFAAAVVVLAAILLGACGGQNQSESTEPAAPVAAPGDVPEATPEAPAAPEPPPPAPPESVPEPAPPEPAPEPAEPEPSAAQSVTSQDGNVTVHAPEGALGEQSLEVSVRALGADERPAALADVELRGTLYELEPDGAEFAEPVTVTRRVDLDQLALDEDQGLPVLTLLTLDGDGAWEALADQTVSYEGTTATVSGKTTHFSTLVSLAGLAFLDMTMTDVSREVEKGWRAKINVTSPSGFGESVEIFEIEPSVGPGGILAPRVARPTGPTSASASFGCEAPGDDTFMVDITLSGIDGLVAPLTGGDPAASTGRAQVTRMGMATCTEPAEDPAPRPPAPADPPPNESGEATDDGAGNDDAAGAGLECEVGVSRFAETENEVVIDFDCNGNADGLTVDPLEQPDMWTQCFVDGGACIPDESGFYFFDVPNAPGGEVFIRNNGPLPSGTVIGGEIFSDGFESGDISAWSNTVP